MIWAFLLGLTVDILGNTPGMNAAAATVLACMREPVVRLVTRRDSVEYFEPGIKLSLIHICYLKKHIIGI